VIADYEDSPTAALRQVFGDQIMASGCWFHYAQAVMKRLKEIGLTAAYRNEEDTQVVFRCLMALPLLPVVDIVPGFEDVKTLIKSCTNVHATNIKAYATL